MEQARIGLIGLGTMGSALALNIAEKGFPIAVWNRTTQVTRDFAAGAGELAPRIVPTESLADLVAAIAPPRAIILMVPAGQPVDAGDDQRVTRAQELKQDVEFGAPLAGGAGLLLGPDHLTTRRT